MLKRLNASMFHLGSRIRPDVNEQLQAFFLQLNPDDELEVHASCLRFLEIYTPKITHETWVVMHAAMTVRVIRGEVIPLQWDLPTIKLYHLVKDNYWR